MTSSSLLNSCASTVCRNRRHISAEALIVRLIGRAIVFYHHNTVPKISHQFLGWSKITEIVKVYDAIVPRVCYPVPGPIASFKLMILLSFRRAPLINNVLRMKTPLKYDTRIRLTSSFNCTSIVPLEDIFIVSLAFFFFAATPCPRLSRG